MEKVRACLLLLLLSHFSCVRLCATPSLGFSRQEHWSGLPFPSPMLKNEKWKWSRSVMSDSSRPHGLQPTRLLRPWDFPGKSTRVGCHCLLHRACLGILNSFLSPFLEERSFSRNQRLSSHWQRDQKIRLLCTGPSELPGAIGQVLSPLCLLFFYLYNYRSIS